MRERIRVHTASDGGRAGRIIRRDFLSFEGLLFPFPRARAPVTSRISIFALFTGRRRSTSRRTTLDANLAPTWFQLLSPLSPRNYRFDFLTISASDSVSIGYVIMQRSYLSISQERGNRFYVKQHNLFLFYLFMASHINFDDNCYNTERQLYNRIYIKFLYSVLDDFCSRASIKAILFQHVLSWISNYRWFTIRITFLLSAQGCE